jgi:beta-glucosidase
MIPPSTVPEPRLPHYRFPEGFRWGAATASYQIEGAANKDGRGLSIWDDFCAQPGKVLNGDTGLVACDHYHRFAEDLDLMQKLGLHSYRFSFAWPRIIPEGTGSVNAKGIAFYDRLIDGMLQREISPAATCYHWDLPLPLHEKGGWTERMIVDAFAKYCEVLAKHFGDRIDMWCTLNEPCVSWILGYGLGTHAPGLCLAQKPYRQVCHHLMMAHGAGVQSLRAGAGRPIEVGLVNNNNVPLPFSETPGDIEAAREHFRLSNGWMQDPLFLGKYPEKEWDDLGPNVPDVREGDLQLICTPTDFFGMNTYFCTQVVRAGGEIIEHEKWYPRTDLGWPITPDIVYWGTRFLQEIYGVGKVYITENGAGFPDVVDDKGRVEDLARVNYLREHLRSAHRAIQEGYPLAGYYVWSLLDNFEWAYGYSKRFGIIHVDYETLKRTPKASAEWYAQTIRNNGL